MIADGNKKANVLADVGGRYSCKYRSCVAVKRAIDREASSYKRCALPCMALG